MQYLLITGASSGIGLTSIQYLLEKGYYVFGSVRKKEDADRLSRRFPERFEALIFDVTDELAIQKAVDSVKVVVGNQGLAGLINNAGIAVIAPLKHLDLERLQYQLEVNVTSVLRMTQHFLPLLGGELSSPFPPGRIINISSVSGQVTMPFIGPYAASKYALESISDAMRHELSIYGIQVVVLEPGPIKTPIWDKTTTQLAPYLETDYGRIFKKMDRVIEQNKKAAIDASVVAKYIHLSLTKKKPKVRYIVASPLNRLRYWFAFNFIPTSVSDYFIHGFLKKQVM